MIFSKAPYIKIMAWSLLALSLVSGCGKTNESDGITMSVSPDKTALIGPGPESSCIDRTNAYREAVTADPDTVVYLERSVSGPTLKYTNFKLHWEKTDENLFVQGIRVTIAGSGITDGSTTVSLSGDEIEMLLGYAGGYLPAGTPPIESNDSSRELPLDVQKFSRCSLVIGSLPLANGNKTSRFTANVTIEVIGTAEKTDTKDQRFIRTKFKAQAKFEGL